MLNAFPGKHCGTGGQHALFAVKIVEREAGDTVTLVYSKGRKGSDPLALHELKNITFLVINSFTGHKKTPIVEDGPCYVP